ncbi:uncharacterized protein LOC131971160 [Centropristis striata]|uniref:uncharacterized protein LOC131971160 n=1 Tax=Centropristis striata TaxID=184440 RepID=UPI0027DEF942|nr:uncharacterized protein LOC131971160 [Centropristis striata]
MQAITVPLQEFLSKVKDNANVFVLSILVYSYHVLDKDFPCSCGPQPGFCSAYMVMPCLILTVLMLLTDLPFQRAWRYTRSKGSCLFGYVLFRRTVRAVCVGLLWNTSVLIDAEWFLCCYDQNPKEVADSQCGSKTDNTPGDTPVVTIAEMKINSRMMGMVLLFGIMFVGAILLSSWTVCVNDNCCLKCCRREVEVHELVLEAGEEVVVKTMKEKQQSLLREKVEEYMAEGKWVSCLDVVEEFIDTIGEDKTKLQHEDNRQQSDEEDSF